MSLVLEQGGVKGDIEITKQANIRGYSIGQQIQLWHHMNKWHFINLIGI